MLPRNIQKKIAALYFAENRSLRGISKELSIHRNTVKKYVTAMERWLMENDGGTGFDNPFNLLEREIEMQRFTDKKMTEEFIQFIEWKWCSAQWKNRMALYNDIRDGDGYRQFLLGSKEVIVDCNVGYSTFCEAIKIVEERCRLRSQSN